VEFRSIVKYRIAVRVLAIFEVGFMVYVGLSGSCIWLEKFLGHIYVVAYQVLFQLSLQWITEKKS